VTIGFEKDPSDDLFEPFGFTCHQVNEASDLLPVAREHDLKRRGISAPTPPNALFVVEIRMVVSPRRQFYRR
jgi:hypothetical protein